MKNCKVRFIDCKRDIVASSDMGLGQVYITTLKTNETVVCRYHVDGANRLKNAMGVAIDPAGLFFHAN